MLCTGCTPRRVMEKLVTPNYLFMSCRGCRDSFTTRSIASDNDDRQQQQQQKKQVKTLQDAIVYLQNWRASGNSPLLHGTKLREPKQKSDCLWTVGTDQRYCPHKGSDHTSSTLWLCINLRDGTLQVKCSSQHLWANKGTAGCNKVTLAVECLPGCYRCSCWGTKRCGGCAVTECYSTPAAATKNWDIVAAQQIVSLAEHWGAAYVKRAGFDPDLASHALFELEKRYVS